MLRSRARCECDEDPNGCCLDSYIVPVLIAPLVGQIPDAGCQLAPSNYQRVPRSRTYFHMSYVQARVSRSQTTMVEAALATPAGALLENTALAWLHLCI